MATIFISYSRTDSKTLNLLLPQIRNAYGDGSYWYDVNGIQGGDDWWKTIESEIQDCQVFLFLMSDNAIQSVYCIGELKKALQHDKQVVQVLLPTLQVSYPQCLPEDLYEELGKKQYVDLRYEYVNEAQCYKDLSRLWGAINKWISNNQSVLSTTERWMLHNQFEILKQINSDHPDYNKNYFDHAMEILSKGYEWYYTDLSQYIYTASFPYSNGLEIINILDMFQSLQFDYEKLEDKSDIDKASLEFVGFGGNEETTEMQFTRFMMKEMGDFDNLEPEHGFNSHFPMLDAYRRMLKVWNTSVDKYRLSKEEIIRITEARDRK